MPNYVDASITTIDGAFTVLDDPISVVDGSEWPSGNFTIKVWDGTDAKVLKAVIYVGSRSTNSLSDLTWNYGGHTDVNLADGDFAALDISAQNYPPNYWTAATIGAYDDYFYTDHSADWTAVNFGTVAWTYGFRPGLGKFRGYSVIYDDQPGSDFCANLKSLSGIATGDYIQTSVANLGLVQNYQWAGLVFTDGTTTTSNAVSLSIMNDNVGGANPKIISGEGTLTAHSTYTINAYINSLPQYDVHLRLTYQAANTWRVQYSLDGDTWLTPAADLSETFTPTHGGFVVSTNGATSANQALFRYFHSNVTP